MQEYRLYFSFRFNGVVPQLDMKINWQLDFLASINNISKTKQNRYFFEANFTGLPKTEVGLIILQRLIVLPL